MVTKHKQEISVILLALVTITRKEGWACVNGS